MILFSGKRHVLKLSVPRDAYIHLKIFCSATVGRFFADEQFHRAIIMYQLQFGHISERFCTSFYSIYPLLMFKKSRLYIYQSAGAIVFRLRQG